mmetsp:Transcript_13316/g.26156  ORF Transcript_13316/g.26156 Transcript_13316/m.26156 type:complete len:221 (-) Transcript_13316:408-1070(-)
MALRLGSLQPQANNLRGKMGRRTIKKRKKKMIGRRQAWMMAIASMVNDLGNRFQHLPTYVTQHGSHYRIASSPGQVRGVIIAAVQSVPDYRRKTETHQLTLSGQAQSGSNDSCRPKRCLSTNASAFGRKRKGNFDCERKILSCNGNALCSKSAKSSCESGNSSVKLSMSAYWNVRGKWCGCASKKIQHGNHGYRAESANCSNWSRPRTPSAGRSLSVRKH